MGRRQRRREREAVAAVEDFEKRTRVHGERAPKEKPPEHNGPQGPYTVTRSEYEQVSR